MTIEGTNDRKTVWYASGAEATAEQAAAAAAAAG